MLIHVLRFGAVFVAMLTIAATHIVGEHQKTSYRIIDAMSLQPGHDGIPKVILRVDRDDNIEAVYRLEDPHGMILEEEIEHIGEQIHASGSIGLSQILPPLEVATRAIRVTHNAELRSHIVVAWGLSKTEDPGSIWYHLYVFTEDMRTNSFKLSYAEKFINHRLQLFAARDWDHDGKVEILDIGGMTKLDMARVRRLEEGGSVSLIQELHFESISFPPQGQEEPVQLVMERKVASAENGSECRSRRILVWSKKASRFVDPDP